MDLFKKIQQPPLIRYTEENHIPQAFITVCNIYHYNLKLWYTISTIVHY